MAFKIGDRVRLTSQPPYFKTADPLPMLRPPDLILVGEEGVVLEQRAGGYWVIKFERGSFLVDGQYLEPATTETTSGETTSEEAS